MAKLIKLVDLQSVSTNCQWRKTKSAKSFQQIKSVMQPINYNLYMLSQQKYFNFLKNNINNSKTIPRLLASLLTILTISACNNSPRNVPFPLQESEFSAPITEKLIFSKPQKLEWVTINKDSFQPIKSEKFDLDKIPSKPIVLGNPIHLLKPMKDSTFDLNSFKDTIFNLDAAPTKKLRYKMALLGQPKRTKSSLPRLKDGASDNLLKFGLDQGLSGTVYSDIKQDKNGIIWITSDDGLNSFDGEYCETFSLGQGGCFPLG